MTSTRSTLRIEAKDALMNKTEILDRVEALLDYCNSGEKTFEKLEAMIRVTEALKAKDYAGIVAVLEGYEPLLAVNSSRRNFTPTSLGRRALPYAR